MLEPYHIAMPVRADYRAANHRAADHRDKDGTGLKSLIKTA